MSNALRTKIDTNLHRKTPQKYIYKTGTEKLTSSRDGDVVLIVFSRRKKRELSNTSPTPLEKKTHKVKTVPRPFQEVFSDASVTVCLSNNSRGNRWWARQPLLLLLWFLMLLWVDANLNSHCDWLTQLFVQKVQNFWKEIPRHPKSLFFAVWHWWVFFFFFFFCKNCSKPSQLSEKNFEFWKCFVFVLSKGTAANKKKR